MITMDDSDFFVLLFLCVLFPIEWFLHRGLLSYKDKVSKHWPDFAQNGKENVTVEQLITNQVLELGMEPLGGYIGILEK